MTVVESTLVECSRCGEKVARWFWGGRGRVYCAVCLDKVLAERAGQ